MKLGNEESWFVYGDDGIEEQKCVYTLYNSVWSLDDFNKLLKGMNFLEHESWTWGKIFILRPNASKAKGGNY